MKKEYLVLEICYFLFRRLHRGEEINLTLTTTVLYLIDAIWGRKEMLDDLFCTVEIKTFLLVLCVFKHAIARILTFL